MESRNKNKFLTLSEPQRMIYLSDRLYPDCSLNTICVTSHLGKSYNLESIKNAISLVIKENPGLHIRVKPIDGIPYQYIDFVLDYEIHVIDFNEVGGKEYEDQWLDSEVNRVFKLDGSPLFKINLYYSTDGDLYLLISTHHIISDAWSHQTITEQISQKYEELINNQTPVFTQKYSYLKYIETENDYIESKRFFKSQEFWRKRFAGLETLPKPIKDFKNSIRSDAKRYRKYFDNKLQVKILDFCSENSISFSKFFLTCLIISLNIINKTSDLLLGTLTYNRLGKNEKEAVGMFVNTLPMLFQMDKDCSFMDIVKKVELEMAGLMRNQRYPLNYLTNDPELKELNIAGNLDVMYSYQNAVQPFDYDYHFCNHSSYPILFRPTRMGVDGDFYLDIDYQISSFSENEVYNFSDVFFKVIHELEDYNVNDAGVFKSFDRKIRYKLNIKQPNENKYNLNQTLHGLFEKKVLEYQDKKAVSFNGNSISYWELNRRANYLAKKLVDLGAGNEKPVVLLLDRSMEMMISILAVLKSGSCYLPLSVEQPITRSQKIIKLSDSNILLHNIDLETDSLKACHCLDVRNVTYPQGDFHNLNIPVKPTNLAYIIYTSGSTGEPKGVMVEHKSVINRLLWMQEEFPLNLDDVVLQKTPYTFDVSVWELFGWYVSGSSLHFLVPGGEKEPVTIVENIYKENVTIIHFVPSMLTLFLEYMDNVGSMDHIKSLRRFNCSGEALLKSQQKKFYSIFSDNIELFNLYGPTEATVEVTMYNCNSCDTSFIPIGKPIDNTEIYILDSEGNVLPVGASGELYIGGVCLARGYFKRDDLTKDKFKVHPVLNKRLYSTGDLAMYLDDGNIKYLGRIDNQVKIRGNRVELSEIEICLSKLPGIKEAAVIAPKDDNDNAYLGAYYVSDTKLLHEDIRAFIKKELPSYMIPSFFLQLSEFPLTASGKLDRKKLPIPERGVYRKSFYAPVNDREEEICEAWEDVLNVENISRTDNFFDLGGDSLKLIKVHFVLQVKYDVSLQDLFEFQTIESLAQHIKLRDNNLLSFNLEEYEEIVKKKQKYNKLNKYQNSIEYFEDCTVVKHRNILITGATGYLGAYIVRDYILETDAKLFLLVRGSDQKEAEKRLFDKLKFYFGVSFIEDLAERVIILNGDITKKELGLTRYSLIKEEVDCVIHCAANVKHFGEKYEVDLINVKGTENIAKFCLDGKKKTLSYISTMSVGINSIENDPVFTEFDIPDHVKNGNVYIESKISAEKFILGLESQLEFKILRVGNVVSDIQEGMFQENYKDNGFYTLINEYLEFGYAPDIEIPFIDLSAVNEVSKAVQKITNSNFTGVYHLYNPNLQTLTSILEDKSVTIEPLRKFMSRLTFGDPLLVHGHYLKNMKLLSLTNYNLKTNVSLEKLGFQWSIIDDDYIIKLWNSWEKVQSNVKITT